MRPPRMIVGQVFTSRHVNCAVRDALLHDPEGPVIAVVVPAHNEQESIGACLRSLLVASQCGALGGEAVMIIVALDACSDGTESIARALGDVCVVSRARNVGHARARGADLALQTGARWLAFTDADTVVAPDWLSAQLALQSDVVCGVVQVSDWGSYGDRVRHHFEATYVGADGHSHIHGANLGISASAYRSAGGFESIASSEDVALVNALHASGASIAWSAAPRVVTSARRDYKAPGGFGETLARSERAGADLQKNAGP